MKTIYSYAFFLMAILLMASCEKDENKMVVLPTDQATASKLSLGGNPHYVATNDNLDSSPIRLLWTETDWGGKEILVSYTLQIDTVADFSTKTELSMGIDKVSLSLSGNMLNSWGLRYSFNKTNPKEVKLFVRLGGSIYVNNTSMVNKPDTVYSNARTIVVEPIAASIYIPGNHQGWDPAKASQLYPLKEGNSFGGYSYLDGEFKFTSTPDWDGTNYGTSDSDGVLSTNSDAGNLDAPAGYYWIELNTKTLAYTLKKVNWTIIGSAIGSWDNDQVLTYDSNKKVLMITTDMVPGEFKFRRDKDWGINFGTDASGKLLVADGNNIKVDAPGTYAITLDFSNPATYNFTITLLK